MASAWHSVLKPAGQRWLTCESAARTHCHRLRLTLRTIPGGSSAKHMTRHQCGAHARHHRLCRSTSSSSEETPAFGQAAVHWNKVCTNLVRVLLNEDEEAAWQLCLELDDLKLDVAHDRDAVRFVAVLQGLLCHTANPEAAAALTPEYQAALNKICTAIQGSGWKVAEPGKPVDSGGQEQARFKTWEEVLGGGRQQQQQQQQQSQAAPAAQQQGGRPDTSLYAALEVGPDASRDQIKAAFKRMALTWHPDVSKHPGAEQRFIEISQAYDILSNEQSRQLYDQFGLEGMKEYEGAAAGAGSSGRLWEEFQPYQRSNKSTRARDASRQSYDSSDGASTPASDSPGSCSSEGAGAASAGPGSDSAAKAGDVVEYPLSEAVMRDCQDGRTHGVGLLVACNADRADRRRLPEEKLGLCEVEPLRQEAAGSCRWVVDELAPFTLCNHADLRVVAGPVQFDYRFDTWTIAGELSPGCGGPEVVEEVML